MNIVLVMILMNSNYLYKNRQLKFFIKVLYRNSFIVIFNYLLTNNINVLKFKII